MEGGFDLSKLKVPDLSKGTELLKQIPDLSKGTELLKQVPDLSKGTELLKQVPDLSKGTGALKQVAQIAPTVAPAMTAPTVAPAIGEAPLLKTESEITSEEPEKKSNLVLMIEKYVTIKNTIMLLVGGLLIVIVWFIIRFLDTNTIIKQNDNPPKNIQVETKEQNSKQVKIDEVERQLQERITNINTNLTALKKRMDDSDIVKDNKPTNLAIAIQNNILAVKEAMMKIIAGLVIQTKMNNGALSVVSQTNAFQQGLNNSINNLTNTK